MFVTIWSYEVEPEHRLAFEALYGESGPWVELFRASPDYVRTILVIDPVRRNLYTSVDVWKTRAAYELFCDEQAAVYAALDDQGDALTKHETHLGTWQLSPDP
jgi:hypothetical protein